MKKLIFLMLLFVGLATVSNAQLSDITKQATAAAGAAGFDVNKIAGDVMGKLTPSLG